MATGTTTVGFEEQLWQAADKLRSNMESSFCQPLSVQDDLRLIYVLTIVSPV